MSQPPPLELRCPRCQIDVQPIQAAENWYCPHCVWQFTAEEVWRQVNERRERPSEDAGE